MPKLDVLSPGSLDFHRVFTVIRGFLVSAFLASRLLSSLDLLCLCCGGGGVGGGMPMRLACSVSFLLRARWGGGRW